MSDARPGTPLGRGEPVLATNASGRELGARLRALLGRMAADGDEHGIFACILHDRPRDPSRMAATREGLI